RSARAVSTAERAAVAVAAAAITCPTRSRNDPVPPTRCPGRAVMATSTTPGTPAAAATPAVRRTRPGRGGTRKRIEAWPGSGSGRGRRKPPRTTASMVAPIRSMPVARRTRGGIRRPAPLVVAHRQQGGGVVADLGRVAAQVDAAAASAVGRLHHHREPDRLGRLGRLLRRDRGGEGRHSHPGGLQSPPLAALVAAA